MIREAGLIKSLRKEEGINLELVLATQQQLQGVRHLSHFKLGASKEVIQLRVLLQGYLL